jgi:hypothetical protein
MRDADHLMMPCKTGQFVADYPAGPPANACVHFIEYKRLHCISGAQDSLQSQHEPGRLTAARHANQRLQRLAPI